MITCQNTEHYTSVSEDVCYRWAIVGVTEQILLGKVENQQYVLETGNLQGHVARLGYQGEALDDENSTHKKTAIMITYDKEYPLKKSK